MPIVLLFPQVCVGWGNKHDTFHRLLEHFLVPTLLKCRIDLCFAVSCNYFYVLGFFFVCSFNVYKVWPLLGQLIWPSVISIYLLHLRVTLSKQAVTVFAELESSLWKVFHLFSSFCQVCLQVLLALSLVFCTFWDGHWLFLSPHVSWEDENILSNFISKLASFYFYLKKSVGPSLLSLHNYSLPPCTYSFPALIHLPT